jgi:N-acetylneuraminic acid mutarotase
LLRTGGRYNPVTDTWHPITTQGAPSGRRNHTAVWTGNSMIVWGGSDTAGASAAGGRYNPVADTWSSIASSNAPVARLGHVAVWSGSEMLVWGGASGYALVPPPPVGGRYNPANNTWKAMSTTNQPVSGSGAAAVWTGNELVVWGGVQPLFVSTYLGTGGRYNPATDTWVQMSALNAPSARSGHTAVWTGTDYLLFGGTNGVTNLNTGARYTLATGVWTPLSLTNAPSARSQHTAVWAGNQMIVYGGNSPNGNANFTSTCHLYDPQADLWTGAANNFYNNVTLPHCGNHCAVWTGQGMLIWGGLSDAGYLSQPFLYYPPRNVDLLMRP